MSHPTNSNDNNVAPSPFEKSPELESPDHVRTLEAEKANFENELATLYKQHRIAAQDTRKCKATYAGLIKRLTILRDARKEYEVELYWATVSGENHVRIAKAEETLRKNNVDQHETQEVMTPGLRALIVALRIENDIQEQIYHKHGLVARREEEIHRYKPCGTWGRCAICHGDADDGDNRNAKYPLYQWKLLLQKPEDRDLTHFDNRPEVVKYFLKNWGENVFNLVYDAKPEGGIFARAKRAFTGLW